MSRYTPYNTEIVDINNLKKEKVKLPFTKMSACSNDYIYINCFENEVSSPEFLSIYLSDRHNGVGGDGVILICPSDVADAQMRMFNRDGSEGLMCGNGIRCVAKYLFDNGIVKKPVINIETKSGIKSCSIMTMNGKAYKITVDMGAAALHPEQVPVKLEGDMVVNKPVIIDGHEYYITCASMGNPHCAVFAPSIDKLDLNAMGPKFEYNPLFPERVNVRVHRGRRRAHPQGTRLGARQRQKRWPRYRCLRGCCRGNAQRQVRKRRGHPRHLKGRRPHRALHR